MADQMQQFFQLLAVLGSTDNAQRNAAEQMFHTLRKDKPDDVIIALMSAISTSPDLAVRERGAVLLRKYLIADEGLWDTCNPTTKEKLKTDLLLALEKAEISSVRKKLGNVIAELGSYALDSDGESNDGFEWNALLPFLFRCVKAENGELRATALIIFSELSTYLGDQLRQHLAVLKQVIESGLQDPFVKARVAAIEACFSALSVCVDKNETAQFQSLIPFIIQALSEALKAQQEEDTQKAIELMIDVASNDPTFFRPHLSMVVDAMLAIASHPTLDDSPEIKQLAVEFVISLCETKAAMMRKLPNLVQRVVPLLLKMMVDLDDDEDEWDKKDDDDEDVDITDSEVGEECVDRLSISLKGKAVIPILFAHLPAMLANTDWKQRHAALMAISNAGEGSAKFLGPHVQEVVNFVLPRLGDPHPRVRWAACNAIGQMATDFVQHDFRKKFHASIIPSLIHVMDDAANPRVQAHAASAIINFCDECDEEFITPYMDLLLQKLFALLQINNKMVQSQAITAVAAVADAAASNFVKYYDTFMPVLKSILQNTTGQKELRKLRGKTLECISLIGIAVGKDKFLSDGSEVMQYLMSSQSQLEPDDPQVPFMLQASARIAQALKDAFVPFLPYIMPPLLQQASIKLDFKIFEEGDTVEEGWDFIAVGNRQLGIHTAAMEEKENACHMIFCYASELGAGFFPFVDPVAKLMIPLLTDNLGEGVRLSAVSTMPALLASTKGHIQATNGDPALVKQLITWMLPEFLKSIKDEDELEILALTLESLAACIDTAGEACLAQDQVQSIVDLITQLFNDISERRTTRIAKQKDEDFDEEEAAALMEQGEKDDECLGCIMEVIGQLAKNYGAGFLYFFQLLLPLVLEMAKADRNPVDRQVAICIFDDVMEHAGPQSASYLGHFLPAIMTAVPDSDARVRQAAVYGIGWVATRAAADAGFKKMCPDITNLLVQVISHADSRSEANANATENAIAALGKFLQYQSDAVDAGALMKAWLSFLPVTVDDVESKITYTQLCGFVESNNPNLLGDAAHLKKLVSVIAATIGTDLVDDVINQRYQAILRKLFEAHPEAFSSLSPQETSNLQKYMQ